MLRMTEIALMFKPKRKIVNKCKIPVINLHFKYFINILIDDDVFELHLCTVLYTIYYKGVIFA